MTGSQHFALGDIQFQLVYDRGQCAESSYLKHLYYRIAMSPTLDLFCKENFDVGEVKLNPTLRSFLHNQSYVWQNCCPISQCFIIS